MISRTTEWLQERRRAFSRTPFGCLVGLFLRRMFRGGDREAGELDLGVGVIVILLAMPGLLVSLLMFEKYGSLIRFLRGEGRFDPFSAAMPDEYFFIILSLAVTGAAMLWRWDDIFLDRRDYLNLVPLPLSLRSIFFANLCAILSLAGVFTLVANGASLLLFPAAVVGSQPSVSLFLRFAAGHAAAVFSASVFAFFAIFGLTGLLAALLPPSALRRVSLSVRFSAVIALVVLLASSFTVPDLLKQLSPTTAHRLAVLPPVSFLGIARGVWGRANDPFSLAMAKSSIVTTALSVVIAFAAYAWSFRASFLRLPELSAAGPGPQISPSFSRLAFLPRLISRSSSELACCQFVAWSLLRSTVHFEILLCFLAVGLVISAAALNVGSLHLAVGSRIAPSVEFLSVPYILSFSILVGIRFAFEIPLDLRANWIFRLWLDPDRYDARSVGRHVLLGITLGWLGPLAFLSAWVFYGWLSALVHTAIWAASTVVLAEILLMRFRKMPFTCPYPAFQSHSPLIVVGYLFGFFIFKTWLPQLDRASVFRAINAVWLIPLLGGVLAGVSWYRSQMLDMDKRLTFEDPSELTFS